MNILLVAQVHKQAYVNFQFEGPHLTEILKLQCKLLLSWIIKATASKTFKLTPFNTVSIEKFVPHMDVQVLGTL